MRLRQRGDIGQRRRRRLLEERRLRHSTRRGPAGDRTRASVLMNQNRALFYCLDALSSREPASASLENALERCPAAKLELLHPVKLTLGKRDGIIEAERTERRRPDQADTHGRADDIAIVKDQSRTGARRRWRCRRPNTIGIGWRGEFAGGGPSGRPLVVIKPAGVGIDSALQADFLRQEPERHL